MKSLIVALLSTGLALAIDSANCLPQFNSILDSNLETDKHVTPKLFPESILEDIGLDFALVEEKNQDSTIPNVQLHYSTEDKIQIKESALLPKAIQKMNLGHALIVTGLAVQTVAGLSQEPMGVLIGFPLGNLAWQSGLLVLGFGSDRVGDAVREISPSYADGTEGWGAYKTNLLFAGIGYSSIIFPAIIFSQLGEKPTEHYLPFLIGGISSLFISDICELVAWQKFTHRANLSRSAYRYKIKTSQKLMIEPFIGLMNQSRLMPTAGLKMSIL